MLRPPPQPPSSFSTVFFVSSACTHGTYIYVYKYIYIYIYMLVDLKVLVRNVVDDGFHVIDGWFGESFLPNA